MSKNTDDLHVSPTFLVPLLRREIENLENEVYELKSELLTTRAAVAQLLPAQEPEGEPKMAEAPDESVADITTLPAED